MPDPIRRPTTPSFIDWERYRIDRIMAIMSDGFPTGGGLTPNRAAAAVDPQILAEFARFFPSESFPLETESSEGLVERTSSATDLPGGIRAADLQYWILAALPRDADGIVRIDTLTAEDIAFMAGAFKPTWRGCPVIRPDGRGPVHQAGQWSAEIPGEVVAAQCDGWGLWLLTEERFEGELDFYASLGAKDRSVSWWFTEPEIGGPYLRHLALVTGERPGVPNMPGLDEFFADRGEGPAIQAATEGGPRLYGSLTVANTTTSTGSATMPDPVTPTTPTEPGAAPTEPATPSLTERVLAAVRGALSSGDETPPVEPATPATPAPVTPPAPPDLTELGTALAAALVPALTEAVAAGVDPVTARLDARELADRDRRVNARLAELVLEQRLAPALVESERSLMTGADCVMTDDAITARLEALSGVPAIFSAAPTHVEVVEGSGESAVTHNMPIPRHLRSPGGAPQLTVAPEDLRIEAEARAATRQITDPAERRAAYVAHIYRAAGVGVDDAGFLNVN